MLLRGAVLLSRTKKWGCPNCVRRAITHEARPHTEFHHCAGLRGLIAPMIEEHMLKKVGIKTVEREDYIGKESVQLDGEGRPVMATVVTRDDGEDRTVYAPTATFDRSDLQ